MLLLYISFSHVEHFLIYYWRIPNQCTCIDIELVICGSLHVYGNDADIKHVTAVLNNCMVSLQNSVNIYVYLWNQSFASVPASYLYTLIADSHSRSIHFIITLYIAPMQTLHILVLLSDALTVNYCFRCSPKQKTFVL